MIAAETYGGSTPPRRCATGTAGTRVPRQAFGESPRCERLTQYLAGEPDEEMLERLEERAPSFRRFAESRDWLLGVLGGSGDVVPFTGRRPGPRRR